MIKQSDVVRKQFNLQAQKFDDWEVTQDLDTFKFLVKFMNIDRSDDVLEFACGTGVMSIYLSKFVRSITGIDITENMIKIGRQKIKDKNIKNIKLICNNAENLEEMKNRFDVVVSKAAFHHMKNYKKIFQNMINLCRAGGKICLQDICSYDDKSDNQKIEELEKFIDASHYKTLSKNDIHEIFKDKKLKVKKVFQNTVKLNLNKYIDHAVQNSNNLVKIKRLMDNNITKLIRKNIIHTENNSLYLERNVISVLGIKTT